MSEALNEIKLAKLAKLRELGLDPYRVERFPVDKSIRQILDGFDSFIPTEEKPEEPQFCLAGRVVGVRDFGGSQFLDLSDGSGAMQVYCKKNRLEGNQFEAVKLADLGDHIGVKGYVFLTKTGERSLHVTEYTPLSKTLHDWPLGKKDKAGNEWYTLTDPEVRYRHRHLDFVCNPENRELLIQRSRIVQAVREFFWSKDFVEVETPMLQLQAGGATARPFLTYYNKYETEVKLRISLELYLKRVMCGNVDKVFELGRVFRNEGVSNRHNPEFTLLEWYEAYANLEDTQTRTEQCFAYVAQKVFGTTVVNGIDFAKPWKRVDLLEAVEKESGITADDLSTFEKAKEAMKRVGLNPDKERNLGGIIEKLLEHFVEGKLIEPTFVVGYPIETSPLAKKDFNRPGFTRRSEGYAFGREVCNMFSEINDPIDQRERFEQQVGEGAKGDEEAHPMDEEFVYTLECGMPPAGGCGIGIDRMVMILLNSHNLREILMFPMMMPED